MRSIHRFAATLKVAGPAVRFSSAWAVSQTVPFGFQSGIAHGRTTAQLRMRFSRFAPCIVACGGRRGWIWFSAHAAASSLRTCRPIRQIHRICSPTIATRAVLGCFPFSTRCL